MTYRERREARAARLREWAEKRADKVESLQKQNERYHGDIAFFTQPGDFTERKRYRARAEQAYAHGQKAGAMASRAGGIEDQLDRSIYSDDPDAIERLDARIAELTAQRDRIKAYNAKQDAAVALALENGPWPSWKLTNLGAEIRRNQARLDGLRRPPSEPVGRLLVSRYPGECSACERPIAVGETIVYQGRGLPIRHAECLPPQDGE